MPVIGISPNTQLIDLKTGRATRDLFLLIQSINQVIADATSEYVLVDATQELTNKTIDGDANTFEDIPTSALKTKTGTGARVVTAAAAGTSGRLAIWNAAGDLASSVDPSDYTTTAALTVLLAAKQDAGAIVILPTYTVVGVPAAASNTRGLIYVSNETGGATVAFSDGTNWRRVQDRAIVS